MVGAPSLNATTHDGLGVERRSQAAPQASDFGALLNLSAMARLDESLCMASCIPVATTDHDKERYQKLK